MGGLRLVLPTAQTLARAAPSVGRIATSTAKPMNTEPGPALPSAAAGRVVSVRGSVVDVRFDGPLPAIHTVLRCGDGERIAIEVLAQRDARHVRGIALTPTQGLARGTVVRSTGAPPSIGWPKT